MGLGAINHTIWSRPGPSAYARRANPAKRTPRRNPTPAAGCNRVIKYDNTARDHHAGEMKKELTCPLPHAYGSQRKLMSG